MKTIMIALSMAAFLLAPSLPAGAQSLRDSIYNPGFLKPIDSTVKVKTGQTAPDFTLPSVSGEKIRLGQYRGKKNVVISFVPAAFTPVCSDQWPGYNMARGLFEQRDPGDLRDLRLAEPVFFLQPEHLALIGWEPRKGSLHGPCPAPVRGPASRGRDPRQRWRSCEGHRPPPGGSRRGREIPCPGARFS